MNTRQDDYYDDENPEYEQDGGYYGNEYGYDNELKGGCGLTLCKTIVAIILIVMALVLFFNAYTMKTSSLFTRLLITLLGIILLCYGLKYLGVTLCL